MYTQYTMQKEGYRPIQKDLYIAKYSQCCCINFQQICQGRVANVSFSDLPCNVSSQSWFDVVCEILLGCYFLARNFHALCKS